MLSEQHKKARLGRITSSIVPAVLGMDPYSSPYDALLKIDGTLEFEGNKATERGNLLEPACLQYAVDKTGLSFEAVPFNGDRAPWAGDSADGLLRDRHGRIDAVIEAKTVNRHSMDLWGEDGTDDVPERVLCQAHWHLLHYPEASRCMVPVLFEVGFEFRMYELPRDADFEAHIWTEAKAWHERHVRDRIPVPISGSEADRRHLVERAPRNWDAMLPCDASLAELIGQRLDAQDAVKKVQKRLDLLSNQLREKIGEHEGIDAGEAGYSVTYRKNADSPRTDWQAVAQALRPAEALIYQHTHVEPGARVLRVAKRRKGRDVA